MGYNVSATLSADKLVNMDQAKVVGQQQSLIFATIGLLFALLLVILLLGGATAELVQASPISAITVLGGPYLSAAGLGRIVGVLISRFKGQKQKSALVGILLAESTLLIAALAGAGAEFTASHNDAGAFEDYILKPVGWIMPLGSIVATVLGIVYSRRVRTLLETEH